MAGNDARRRGHGVAERHHSVHRPEWPQRGHGRVHLCAERAGAPRIDGRAAAFGRLAHGQRGRRPDGLLRALHDARALARPRAQRHCVLARGAARQAKGARALASALSRVAPPERGQQRHRDARRDDGRDGLLVR